MRLFDIAWKDIKTIARDLKALAIILAMPLITIMILGAALGPMFARKDRVDPFKVALVDLDQGQVSSLFVELMTSDRVKSLVRLQNAASEEAARALITEDVVACAVVIPEGASSGKLTGSSLKVLGDPAEPIRSQIVSGIVSAFAEQYSVIAAGTSSVIHEVLRVTAPADTQELANRVIRSLTHETAASAEVFAESRQEAKWITSLQYYTAGMTVMFVLFGAMLGVRSILEEKQAGTMARLFTTKVTPREIMAGKMLGTFTIAFTQIVILILFTRHVYGVSWGPSLPNAVAVSAVVAFAATGFTLLLAALSKTEKVADAVENIGVQVMAFLGGCQYPIYGFPKVMQSVSRLTVTRWGLDAYLALMDGQTLAQVATPLAVLLAMGFGFLAVGLWRLRLD